jgi:hypothetical protein
MTVNNAKCQIMPVDHVLVKGEAISAKGAGLLVLKVHGEHQGEVRDFLKWLTSQEKWRELPLSMDLKKWYKAKSYDQVKLLWALIEIMCVEQEGKHDADLKLEYYKGLLSLYAPRVKAKMTGEEIVKTLSEMNSYEASLLIEGAFRELALMGLSLEGSSKIANYWIEWRNWRGEAKKEEWDLRSIEEYRQAVPYCEACRQPGEHMAHIISKGAGARSGEAGYFLHLCTTHHIGLQHTAGWVRLVKEFPHLKWKINVAREKWGLPPIEEAEDLYKEAEEPEEKNLELF